MCLERAAVYIAERGLSELAVASAGTGANPFPAGTPMPIVHERYVSEYWAAPAPARRPRR